MHANCEPFMRHLQHDLEKSVCKSPRNDFYSQNSRNGKLGGNLQKCTSPPISNEKCRVSHYIAANNYYKSHTCQEIL